MPTSRTHPRIWALLDGRAGNDSQTLGIAQALGLPFERVHLKLTPLSRLANIARGARLWGLSKNSKMRITAPYPDIVIATGRRLATTSLYIKKKHPNTKLIHMMHPEIALDHFDVVVMPAHDNPPTRENIFTTLGAPHSVNIPLQTTDPEKVVVLVGGDTKKGNFTKQDTKKLILQLLAIVAQGKKLYISTSRRTPLHCTKALIHTFAPAGHTIFIYGNGQPNPYPTMLQDAEMIIVTGDSVGMCSEACSLGKPVYIFMPKHALAPKHRAMIEQLVKEGYARFTSDLKKSWSGGLILQEAQRIAPLIRTRIGITT